MQIYSDEKKIIFFETSAIVLADKRESNLCWIEKPYYWISNTKMKKHKVLYIDMHFSFLQKYPHTLYNLRNWSFIIKIDIQKIESFIAIIKRLKDYNAINEASIYNRKIMRNFFVYFDLLNSPTLMTELGIAFCF